MDIDIDVDTIRKAMKGVPGNSFVRIRTITKPPEISAVFIRGAVFERLPKGAGPHRTTSKGRRVVGTLVIEVEVSDATWGDENRQILNKHLAKARKAAAREIKQ